MKGRAIFEPKLTKCRELPKGLRQHRQVDLLKGGEVLNYGRKLSTIKLQDSVRRKVIYGLRFEGCCPALGSQ